VTIALIVHGGATSIPPEEEQAYADGCRAALEAGWAVLEAEGAALDAVEAAVRVLEADPTFNAGCGGALNADGAVELDAAVMEGGDLRFGAVAAVMGVPHPISAARRLLDTQGPRLLVARGAERGCIVLDRSGRIGWAHNSSHMSCAWRTSEMEAARVMLKK
jgi:L-asparaginase / beta-aspartyl-peptidase